MKAAGYAAAVLVAREIGYPVIVRPDPPGMPRFKVSSEADLKNAVTRCLIASSTGCVNVTEPEQ